MPLWDVHVTMREPNGRKMNELCGIAASDELDEVLGTAVAKACDLGGGVEIRPHRGGRLGDRTRPYTGG